MGAISLKLQQSFRAPRNAKAPGGRSRRAVFRPKAKPIRGGKISLGPAFSMANRLLSADARNEQQMATQFMRQEKFGGRLDNAGTIQGMLDDLNMQADQLLGGLDTTEEG